MRRLAIMLAMMLAPTAVMAAEMTVTLAVENMTCATCPIAVRTAIKAVLGVKDVKVDFAQKFAVVVFDDTRTNVDKLAEASRNAGFPATLKE